MHLFKNTGRINADGLCHSDFFEAPNHLKPKNLLFCDKYPFQVRDADKLRYMRFLLPITFLAIPEQVSCTNLSLSVSGNRVFAA